MSPLSSIFSPIWALTVYCCRFFFELVLLRGGIHGIPKSVILQKLKSLGPDLYWLGVVMWGVVMIGLNPDNRFIRFISTIGSDQDAIIIRIVCLPFLLVIGGSLIFLKNKDEEATKYNRMRTEEEDQRSLRTHLFIAFVGIINLLASIYYMYPVN